jgi:hypothetical protein
VRHVQPARAICHKHAMAVAEVLTGSPALPVALPARITVARANALSWIVLPIHPSYVHVPVCTAGDGSSDPVRRPLVFAGARRTDRPPRRVGSP